MTALELLLDALPPHRVADLLSRNPEDDLLLPLVASWIGDEPPYTRAQVLLDAAAAVRSERKPPAMHPAIADHALRLKNRIADLERQIADVERRSTLIAGFFELANGTIERVAKNDAYTSINVSSFLASEEPTLAERISRITQFLGVEPRSYAYQGAECQVYAWHVDGYKFKLFAILRDE